MLSTTEQLLVPENFIRATRDSGYKSFGAAIAELLDNSFQALALTAWIEIRRESNNQHELIISVADDGEGMNLDIRASTTNALRPKPTADMH
jgi:sensor histidine kinase regulating citrate/malate metabolism